MIKKDFYIFMYNYMKKVFILYICIYVQSVFCCSSKKSLVICKYLHIYIYYIYIYTLGTGMFIYFILASLERQAF